MIFASRCLSKSPEPSQSQKAESDHLTSRYIHVFYINDERPGGTENKTELSRTLTFLSDVSINFSQTCRGTR